MKPHAALSLNLDNSWSFCESFCELNIIDPTARIKIASQQSRFLQNCCLYHHLLICLPISACRKWRLGAQGSGVWYQQPKPRLVEHPISVPHLQLSHEPRPPHQTPNQAPVTLNSEFNGKNYEGEAPTLLSSERREGKY